MNFITYLIGIVKSTFGAAPAFLDAEAMQNRRDKNVKSICSDLARGNISLIRGKFLTTKELEARRSANMAHKFN